DPHRPAVREPGGEHLDLAGQRVARPHRGRPVQLLHPRRAKAAGLRDQVAHQQAHEEGARVPAAGDQTAVDREARRIGVEVHRLRVIVLRKTNDVRLADLDTTEVDELAYMEILVVAHDHPTMYPPPLRGRAGWGALHSSRWQHLNQHDSKAPMAPGARPSPPTRSWRGSSAYRRSSSTATTSIGLRGGPPRPAAMSSSGAVPTGASQTSRRASTTRGPGSTSTAAGRTWCGKASSGSRISRISASTGRIRGGHPSPSPRPRTSATPISCSTRGTSG